MFDYGGFMVRFTSQNLNIILQHFFLLGLKIQASPSMDEHLPVILSHIMGLYFRNNASVCWCFWLFPTVLYIMQTIKRCYLYEFRWSANFPHILCLCLLYHHHRIQGDPCVMPCHTICSICYRWDRKSTTLPSICGFKSIIFRYNWGACSQSSKNWNFIQRWHGSSRGNFSKTGLARGKVLHSSRSRKSWRSYFTP